VNRDPLKLDKYFYKMLIVCYVWNLPVPKIFSAHDAHQWCSPTECLHLWFSHHWWLCVLNHYCIFCNKQKCHDNTQVNMFAQHTFLTTGSVTKLSLKILAFLRLHIWFCAFMLKCTWQCKTNFWVPFCYKIETVDGKSWVNRTSRRSTGLSVTYHTRGVFIGLLCPDYL